MEFVLFALPSILIYSCVVFLWRSAYDQWIALAGCYAYFAKWLIGKSYLFELLDAEFSNIYMLLISTFYLQSLLFSSSYYYFFLPLFNDFLFCCFLICSIQQGEFVAYWLSLNIYNSYIFLQSKFFLCIKLIVSIKMDFYLYLT